MNQLSEKELSMLSDALTEEELLVKKYNMLASQSSDRQTSDMFQSISKKHQNHYNSLYSLLG